MKILSNIIVNNSAGILTDSSGLTDFFISDNNFSNNAIAIDGRISDSVISGNTISDNSGAITLSESVNVTLNGNNIFNNSFGLNLNGDSNSYIYGNNITANTRNYQYGNNAGFNSGFGILFAAGCNDIFVYENNIEGNIFGVYLVNSQLGVLPSFGSGNVVYRNNMVNNSQNVNVDQGLSYNVEGRVVNGTTAVSWDNGTIGNYWSDYQSKYPNATEIQSSGIGNEPYVINENNTDHYPLVQQVTNTVGEPPAHSQELLVLITTIVILAVVISLIIYIRNRKKIDNNPFLRIAVFWVGYVGAAFLAFVAPNRFLSTVRTFALNHRSSACGAG